MSHNLKPNKSWPSLPLVIVQLLLPAVVVAQDMKPAAAIVHESAEAIVPPTALTISFHGTCDYSEDGVTFSKLERAHIFAQGATVRTGDDGRVDLFFRRTGITVRLQAGTEIKLETMTVTMKDGLPVVRTLLDLRTGRIFAVVRSAVAGSTLEIKNAAGRSVVEGSGTGKYIITADGTHVSAEGSVIPLKVVGENGITLVSAGQQFSPKDGKMLPLSASWKVKEMIELDEIEASSEAAGAETPPPKP
jgi:hypothetical protein